jgi:hypothetical protein
VNININLTIDLFKNTINIIIKNGKGKEGTGSQRSAVQAVVRGKTRYVQSNAVNSAKKIQ